MNHKKFLYKYIPDKIWDILILESYLLCNLKCKFNWVFCIFYWSFDSKSNSLFRFLISDESPPEINSGIPMPNKTLLQAFERNRKPQPQGLHYISGFGSLCNAASFCSLQF